jgi:hypothetical protein
MKKLMSIALVSLLAVSAQAFADREHPRHRVRDPGVNQRQYNQQHRINQGVRSGQLTGQETHQLRQEEKQVRQEERTYKSDGRMTKDERKNLHQDLNQISKDIYTEKHDGEVRPKATQ